MRWAALWVSWRRSSWPPRIVTRWIGGCCQHLGDRVGRRKELQQNNIFGWGSARRGFASIRGSIDWVASRLARSKLYKGKDLDEYSQPTTRAPATLRASSRS